MLRGPGVGKGTQCALLAKHFPTIQHFSAGSLLREASLLGDREGNIIQSIISEGGIIPGNITLRLLRSAVNNAQRELILIDGFPRSLQQGLQFEKEIQPCDFALYFDAPLSHLNARLIQRQKQSYECRSDDNEECRRKRFHVHQTECMPVVDHYEREGKLIRIAATASPNEIFGTVKNVMQDLLSEKIISPEPTDKHLHMYHN